MVSPIHTSSLSLDLSAPLCLARSSSHLTKPAAALAVCETARNPASVPLPRPPRLRPNPCATYSGFEPTPSEPSSRDPSPPRPRPFLSLSLFKQRWISPLQPPSPSTPAHPSIVVTSSNSEPSPSSSPPSHKINDRRSLRTKSADERHLHAKIGKPPVSSPPSSRKITPPPRCRLCGKSAATPPREISPDLCAP